MLGVSGYAGGELVRLLWDHPEVELTFVGGKDSAGSTLGEVHPHLSELGQIRILPIDDLGLISESAEVAFLALPNGSSSGLAPGLLDAGSKVIDLAGDFRLAATDYPTWYGFDHPAPGWLDEAAYGLPELFTERIADARLVANPGCYPTPAILGLAPLLAAGLIEPGPIRVDGKTGITGAGRAASGIGSFAATEESIRPYRAPGHQHTPEMERGIRLASGKDIDVLFVPHLVPAVRGVLVSCYAVAAQGATSSAVTECLSATYDGEPFVRVLPAGSMVDSKRTRGSNMVELQAFVDDRSGTAVVVGAVDNLIKGAAGQAIQNLNLLIGADQTTALPRLAMYP